MVKGLRVNEEKCTGCGICAEVCRTNEIKLNDRGIPQPVRPNQTCFMCGHCVAVCPTSAISYEGMTPENCTPFQKDTLSSIEKVDTLLKSRRSISNYQNKSVPRDTIQNLIEVARYSPSGLNAQPVNWTVVYDRDDVQRYASMTIDWLRSVRNDPAWNTRIPIETYLGNWDNGREVVTYDAPHLVMVHAEGRWEEECKMAMTFFDLVAHSRGLGTCWMGLLNLAANIWEPLKKDLAYPETHKSFGVMTLGYPRYSYLRIPTRKEPVITWK
jgi:nitroreductase/NAD-dependent dihydropyrimidine dehydrogenase PreA subunit